VPSLVIFLSASSGRMNIGERYILPMYPYLLMASAACPLLAAGRGRAVAAAVLGAHALSSLLAAPGGYISYFNVVAGGREGGHRVLLDSNLDWGQDLPRLARWMKENGIERIQLAYHGADDPARFGIVHEDVDGRHLYPAHEARDRVSGTFAISPNILLGLFDTPGHNPWAWLLQRKPFGRAGVYSIYRID
jgi:hypothetical protein